MPNIVYTILTSIVKAFAGELVLWGAKKLYEKKFATKKEQVNSENVDIEVKMKEKKPRYITIKEG